MIEKIVNYILSRFLNAIVILAWWNLLAQHFYQIPAGNYFACIVIDFLISFLTDNSSSVLTMSKNEIDAVKKDERILLIYSENIGSIYFAQFIGFIIISILWR